MKTIESQLKRLKHYLYSFVTIVKFPTKLNGVCKYGIRDVDTKNEAREFYKNHFNFDKFSPYHGSWMDNTIQLLLRSPEFLLPGENDSFTFGVPGSPGAKAYSLVDLNDVRYNVYGYERVVLIESGRNGGSLTYIQSTNGDDIVIYQTGITVRVWFARAGDTTGKSSLWVFLGRALPKELRDGLQIRLSRSF